MNRGAPKPMAMLTRRLATAGRRTPSVCVAGLSIWWRANSAELAQQLAQFRARPRRHLGGDDVQVPLSLDLARIRSPVDGTVDAAGRLGGQTGSVMPGWCGPSCAAAGA